MLVVHTQVLEHAILLRCIGRIVAGEEVNTLRGAALAHGDHPNMILDLSNISTLDGAGIGLLAFLQARARCKNLRMRIQNPSTRVRQLLELTNLDSVIEITPSREFEDICDTIRGGRCAEVAQAAAH